MPISLVAIVSGAVIAAGGVGLGNALLGSGGSSTAPAARVPSLTADPTGPPSFSRFSYGAPPAQSGVPSLGAIQGQTPIGGAPAPGSAYVAHGTPKTPFGHVPTSTPPSPATTWPLYLSGADLLQPDEGVADATDQSIGTSLAGACGAGLAGRWTLPATATFPFHGTLPGLLQVAASSPVTMTISLTESTYGESCSVLSSTTVSTSGNHAVAFTLPRVDLDIPEGANISLVVATGGSARIQSSPAARSYVIAPTAPQ